ncbi:hypothetical protein AZ78_0472 [Lysobacter capsici AZ78]|uniref:Uncharacterized protein n=1 Tax=Lysobacter capsici AZ78 TaxID=1444315 RepID=A0A108U5H8_9GAMM|nr:hypothetical protein AZ78_0472 [Lysobacter capsici AZ78]
MADRELAHDRFPLCRPNALPARPGDGRTAATPIKVCA